MMGVSRVRTLGESDQGGLPMDFPIKHLLDPQASYDELVFLLHPEGLRCPNGHDLAQCYVHKRDRAPVVDYRCKVCGRCFNAFSGTLWHGTYYAPVKIMLFLRGIAQGVSTAQLARELGANRGWLLHRRHQMQALAQRAFGDEVLPDDMTEADEMYQNAGEKGHAAHRSGRSPAAPGQQGAGARHLGQ